MRLWRRRLAVSPPVQDRRLPDKANLVDEAGARVRIAMFSIPSDLKASRHGRRSWAP